MTDPDGYVDEIQHPETGEFIILAADTASSLERQIAEALADVVDLDSSPSRGEVA